MAKLYLQRHTKPHIAPQICYGVSDIELDEGYTTRDLPVVLERLNGVRVSKIYSSPLIRCLTLARDIQRTNSIANLTTDFRLLELNFGEWELMSWDAIYATAEGKAWFDDFIDTPTLNGESFREMITRVEEFIAMLQKRGEDAIVVTHSGVLRAAMVIMGRIRIDEAFGVEIDYGAMIEMDL